MLIIYSHPRCTTVKKALNFFDDNNINYETRDLTKQAITRENIEIYHKISGLPLKKFFNTSGILYREKELSKKLGDMSENEQYDLLATDGMLIKRPLVTDGNKVTVGFNIEQFENTWK